MSLDVLQVQGLVSFVEGAAGLRRILDGTELTVRAGRPCALLGESGSGKTLLLHSLLGLHRGVPGIVAGRANLMGVELFQGLLEQVVFEDGPAPRIHKDCAGWERGLRRRLAGVLGRRVTLVPQDPLTSLSPHHAVGRLLETAVRVARPGASQVEVRREALGWLERVHMYDVSNVERRYLHELSGGMAQRVALALALAPGPDLLVADEPTTGLDATLRVRVLDLLAEAVRSCGATLLLITHDTEVASLLAEDVAVLCAGRVVEEGPAATVLDRSTPRKHPYTRFLLGAEHPGGDGGRPAEGVGCAFQGRCPRASALCAHGPVAMREIGPGHRLACRLEAP